MTTSEHLRRTALGRANRLHPGPASMRKPGALTKKELNDMLHEAVKETAAIAEQLNTGE